MSGKVRDRDIQRFLQELEQGIRDINRTHIHAVLPTVTRETVLSLEASVAQLRAGYLEAACVSASGGSPDAAAVASLREKRQAFEEMRKAHEALLYAIERGYVDIDELTPEG
jgi:hypothetical protein